MISIQQYDKYSHHVECPLLEYRQLLWSSHSLSSNHLVIDRYVYLVSKQNAPFLKLY